MHLWRLLLTLCLFMLPALLSCEKDPIVRPLAPDAVVLAFGDSLTYGTGASEGSSYPAVLEGVISRTVVNAGIAGEVTSEGLRRLFELLDENRPDLVILCHGGNDMLRRMGDEAAAQNIRSMILAARERGIDVILIGVPRPGIFLDPPEFYGQIAQEFGIPYEGMVMKRVLSDGSLKSDPIHPNEQGYRMIAESIAALLRKGGAI